MAPSTTAHEVVRIVRTFAAPRDKVFEAWTNPALMANWFARDPAFGPTRIIEADVRTGGRYRVEVEAGERYVGWGVYQDVTPPTKLVFTWNWEHHGFSDAVVTVDFADAPDGGTVVTLRHELLPTAIDRDAHRKGWHGCFEMLDRVVAPATP